MAGSESESAIERVVGDRRTIGSAEDLTIWFAVSCVRKETIVRPLCRGTTLGHSQHPRHERVRVDQRTEGGRYILKPSGSGV